MSDRSQASLPKDQATVLHDQKSAHNELAQPIPAVTTQPFDQPLPRPKRQRRRAKADRGLPPDKELQQLATEYLRVQSRHWPSMVKAGLLPAISDDAVTTMVEDFKHRHRTGQVDPAPLQVCLKFCAKLAGDYSRYSCDNSSPTSIIDQMVNGLNKARQEDRFVPWQYVFADYSVSGLNPSRQGYSSYKAMLQDGDHLIETTYVDDFTRPSRDEVEWWRLAYLSRRLQRRMIGASDGFDLSAPNWDMMISLYGLLSRLFIKGLREKVKRGMRGAARRGGCLGSLSLGFTRAIRRDKQGNVVRDKDGVPEHVPCIDPATRDARKLMYELFVEKCWSSFKIAKHFNVLKVDGWDGWTQGGIRDLLWSASAIGVFMWNKTRREYDYEEEKWVVVPNPRKEWEVFYDPDLAIVPLALWKAARKKLVATRRKSPLTGRKMSRNEKSATTLFSGTLYCSYCGKELLLCRSAGRYKVMGCQNGWLGAHGCGLSSSKSTRIIEKCLLGYLQDRLLTKEKVEELVAKANDFLTQEASKPRVDTAPLKARIREKEAAIKRLFQRIEGQEDENLCQAYEKRIGDLQKEVNELKSQLHAADAENVPPPPPLDVAAVKTLLADLRGLLNQEIPAAAEAIRALTGPITIRQEKIPGQERGAKWIATFTPDLLGWLCRGVRAKDYPESITLEYLGTRIWITPETVDVVVDHVPKYEELSGKVAELAAKGASVNTIAAALGETWVTVNQALDFARTGQRPKTRPAGKRTGKGQSGHRKIDVAEVIRLRDERRLSFKKIAQRLGVSEGTAVRAYDRGNPQAVREAADHGQKPKRGRYSHLEPEVFEQIRAGVEAGRAAEMIAAEADCGISTVYRVRKQMLSAQEQGSDAEASR